MGGTESIIADSLGALRNSQTLTTERRGDSPPSNMASYHVNKTFQVQARVINLPESDLLQLGGSPDKFALAALQKQLQLKRG